MGLDIAAIITATVATSVGVAGGIVNYDQQKKNTQAQAESLEHNARIEKRDAENAETEANEAAIRQRAENERLRSAQRASLGKSGVAVSTGSPLAVLGETAAMQELEVADTQRAGGVAYGQHMTAANAYEYQAKLANSQSGLGLALSLSNTVVSGVSSGLSGYMAGDTYQKKYGSGS